MSEKVSDFALEAYRVGGLPGDRDPLTDVALMAVELIELRAKVVWRPIETAPKDGKEILICNNGLVRLSFWDEARGGVWSLWPGRQLAHPTHWQPLPPVPTSEKAT